jgi:hypothetical protein
VNTCLLQLFILNREPHIAVMIDLIDKLKKRASFQQSITDTILDVCKHFEEGCISNLRKTQNVS